jgi:O-antigen/teichoic acid export membrane protein
MTARAGGGFSLGLANALALLAALAAASVYARWLDAAQMGHWAAALAVARAGMLLLDGGLKTALVRRAVEADLATMRRLVRLCTQVALAMTFAIALIVAGLWARGRLSAGEALLQLAYPAAYLLAYPPLLAALARLERAQCFAAVGRAEGASVLVEFGLPAALLGLGLPFWAGFAVSAVAARLLRAAMLALAARGSNLAESGPESAATETAPTRSLLKEGAGVQAVAALSMLRDQMHLWLVAPWFGAAWAGSYSFAYAAGMVVSQVAVQTAARVSLPQLRELDPSRRWARVLSQTRWLAIATLPPLALLPAWLAQADRLWWDGRWSLAVQITFWVALRMVAGVATTTLGNWLLVARDPWQSARANAYDGADRAHRSGRLGRAGAMGRGGLDARRRQPRGCLEASSAGTDPGVADATIGLVCLGPGALGLAAAGATAVPECGRCDTAAAAVLAFRAGVAAFMRHVVAPATARCTVCCDAACSLIP